MWQIWWNFAIAPAFAWMGAFAEAVGGLHSVWISNTLLLS
jgi:hypothetical protein